MVDLEHTVKFEDRDCLILEDGRLVQIIASDEELMQVRARDAAHLTLLAWHIGNRHLPAQIETTRILIRRDHVIKSMLEKLGAETSLTCAKPFRRNMEPMPMTTDNASLLLLLNWMSPTFPIGSFAYSHGLEQAIADGRLKTGEDVQSWIADLLRSGSGWNDAVFFTRCWQDDVAELE